MLNGKARIPSRGGLRTRSTVKTTTTTTTKPDTRLERWILQRAHKTDAPDEYGKHDRDGAQWRKMLLTHRIRGCLLLIAPLCCPACAMCIVSDPTKTTLNNSAQTVGWAPRPGRDRWVCTRIWYLHERGTEAHKYRISRSNYTRCGDPLMSPPAPFLLGCPKQ